jgi:hypothetical protein
MGLMLSQHKYAFEIFHIAGMSSCKPVDTPYSSSNLDMMFGALFSYPT